MGEFTIIGTAKRNVEYDMVDCIVTFRALEDEPYEASVKAMDECERFLKEMRTLGLDSRNVILKDDCLDEENYRDDLKYESIRKIVVRIQFNMELVNTIRSILNKGLYRAEFDIRYSFSKEKEIRDILQKEALLNSRRQAFELAKTMGLEVKGIHSFKAYNSSDYVYVIENCMYEQCFCLSARGYEESNKLKASTVLCRGLL